MVPFGAIWCRLASLELPQLSTCSSFEHVLSRTCTTGSLPVFLLPVSPATKQRRQNDGQTTTKRRSRNEQGTNKERSRNGKGTAKRRSIDGELTAKRRPPGEDL
ncbi:hypothetical protein [Arcticibacter sp. MXS-1]|uniref:hypothetical protein n=1 Tax=Arcticibacter sp. MXS-1 TaxID=3341726 RepID=UPI0035A84BB6